MNKREEIKKDFLRRAIEYGQAIAIGDYKKANKIHKELNVIYNIAKLNNMEGVFREMFYEDDENVKLWAATFTLKYSPDEAEKALYELSKLMGITGLTAKATLQMWREGKLDLI